MTRSGGLLCAIHQPNLFPRLSTLAKLFTADIWIALDDVQFARRDYQHRARLGRHDDPNAQQWMSLPVRSPNGRRSLINDIMILERDRSIRRILRMTATSRPWTPLVRSRGRHRPGGRDDQQGSSHSRTWRSPPRCRFSNYSTGPAPSFAVATSSSPPTDRRVWPISPMLSVPPPTCAAPAAPTTCGQICSTSETSVSPTSRSQRLRGTKSGRALND